MIDLILVKPATIFEIALNLAKDYVCVVFISNLNAKGYYDCEQFSIASVDHTMHLC